MKNSEMHTQKIMNYLYGEMNNHEKVTFEKDILENKELREEFLLQQEIDTAIKNELKVDQFRNILNNIHENQIDKKETKILNLRNKWYWAAASITIFSGTAIYTLKHHFKNPDRLFESYYQVWEPSVITRGLDTEEFTKKIINDFEQGRFYNVISLLDITFSTQSLDPRLILLKGCAQMEIQDFNSAIKTFSAFESNDYTFYTEAGQWYQALCYLKIKEIDKSKQILKTLVDRNTSYSGEAGELMKELK